MTGGGGRGDRWVPVITNIKVWRARALSWKPIRHSAIHYQYREVRNQIKSGEVMRDKSVA